MPRPITLSILILATLGPAVAVYGQEDWPGGEILMGKPWSVPDSQEVLFLRSEAKQAVDAGAYEKAALKLQTILDYHSNQVILVGSARDERFIGARRWVHGFLRRIPAEARAAYRALAGPAAERLIRRAENERSEALLLEAIRRYYLSGRGADALRALASLKIVSGSYLDAAHYLSMLLRDFPDEVRPEDRARLALARVRAGRAEAAADLIRGRDDLPDADAEIRVGGRGTTLARFLATLEPELDALAERPDAARPDWPVYGGSADRIRPAPPFGGIGPAEWFARTGYTLRDDDHQARDLGPSRRWATEWLTADHYPIHPVVEDGVVYFQNGSTVHAQNLLTGAPLWSADGPIVRNNLGKTNPGTVHAVTVANGLVYAALEIPIPPPPRNAREYANRTVIYYIPQRRLFAFEAATGRLVWSHEEGIARPPEEQALLEDLNTNSPPLVVGDTLFVTASRLDNRYFCYVLAVDARTGRVKWRTRVCTGQQELNLFGRPIKELAGGALSERDGKLYLSSNLGVAASLDRRTGEILWARGYPQIPIPYSTRWYTTEERSPTWTNAPPIVTADAVFLTPTDSTKLVALERETGELRFLFDGGGTRDPEFRRMIGAGPDYLYVTGSRVAAIDRRTGKIVWSSDRGTFESGEEPGERDVARGRGLVTSRAVWTASRLGLYSFDLKTGRRLSFDPILPPEAGRRAFEEAGGNLLFAGNVLVLASRDGVTAYYSKERVYELLRDRARKAPRDPRVALELAEIYAKWGQFDEAVEEYRRALTLADRLSADEAWRLRSAANRGLFTIHVRRGREAVETNRPEIARREFESALAAATDDDGRVRARLGLADVARSEGDREALREAWTALEAELGDVVHPFEPGGPMPAGLAALIALTDLELAADRPGRAIRHLSKIIRKYPDRELAGRGRAHGYARDRIDEVLAARGREVYAPQEAEARRRFELALEAKSSDLLAEVVRLYPNSRTAEEASVALGKLLLLEGDYRKASATLRRILSEFPDSRAAPTILMLLSKALEKREFLVSAKSALTRLARRHPDATIEVDGREVNAGAWARARLEEPMFARLSIRTPRVSLPLAELWMEDQGSSAYVKVLEPAGVIPPGIERQLLLGENGLLRAVDATEHRTVWQREMSGIVTEPVYAEGYLVLVDTESICAVDPDTGSLVWETPVPATIRAVAGSPGLVFLLTADFRDPTDLLLRAFSPRTGEVVWQRNIANRQLYDLLLVTEEAVAFAAREPSGITVLDAATGSVRFEVEMLPRSLFREPFLVDGDKLLVIHGNQRFELYDTATGRSLWEATLPDRRYFRSAIPVAGGVLFTDTMENLMLLDVADGRIRWTVDANKKEPIQFQGEAADRERVYVVRRREADNIYFAEARRLETGELIWRRELVESGSATPTPIVTDKRVIYHVNSYDFGRGEWTSRTLILDKEDGEVLQALEPEALQGFFTYAVLQDGIYCLNARGKVVVYGPE